MPTISQIAQLAKENREAINKILSESLELNEIDDVIGLNSDDLILVFDSSGQITGKSTIQNMFNLLNIRDNTIEIAGYLWDFYKNPTNSNPSIEVYDVIKNGYISGGILIQYAMYNNTLNNGDINNIGTLANNFKDGNYKNVRYTKLY